MLPDRTGYWWVQFGKAQLPRLTLVEVVGDEARFAEFGDVGTRLCRHYPSALWRWVEPPTTLHREQAREGGG